MIEVRGVFRKSRLRKRGDHILRGYSSRHDSKKWKNNRFDRKAGHVTSVAN